MYIYILVNYNIRQFQATGKKIYIKKKNRETKTEKFMVDVMKSDMKLTIEIVHYKSTNIY